MTSKEYVENVVVPMYMKNRKCTKEEAYNEQTGLFELLSKSPIESLTEMFPVHDLKTARSIDDLYRSNAESITSYKYPALSEKNKKWYDIIFIKHNNKYYIVFVERVAGVATCMSCYGRSYRTTVYNQAISFMYETTKEEGNKFWMMLKKNESTSKKGNTLTKIDINWRK